MTEEKFTKFARKRSIPIRKMFVIRNARRDSACIKLVVDDCDLIQGFDDPVFWPNGVYCRPWVSKSSKSFTQRNNVDSGSYNRYDYETGKLYHRADIDEYNPYLYLDSDHE